MAKKKKSSALTTIGIYYRFERGAIAFKTKLLQKPRPQLGTPHSLGSGFCAIPSQLGLKGFTAKF